METVRINQARLRQREEQLVRGNFKDVSGKGIGTPIINLI